MSSLHADQNDGRDAQHNTSPDNPLVSYWAWEPTVLSELERVSTLVREESQSAGGTIGNALVQYTSRPGKMLRPALTVIGTWAGPRVTSPLPDHFIQIAAAIEVLHLSTLIHDDVIDEATVRRRGPALHTLYGKRQAVLMGDYLLSRCFSMIAAGTSRENAERLASATGHICRGELGQLDEATNPSFSRREYLRRIIGKTALLFTASLVVGATEAKASRADTAALARVGYNVGMAFQIIDDLLDFTADRSVLGKPTASDLRSGLYTLPVVEAASNNPEIRTVFRTPPSTHAEVEKAVAMIRDAGGFAASRRAAKQYTLRAERAVSSLSSARQRAVLTELTQRLLHRSY